MTTIMELVGHVGDVLKSVWGVMGRHVVLSVVMACLMVSFAWFMTAQLNRIGFEIGLSGFLLLWLGLAVLQITLGLLVSLMNSKKPPKKAIPRNISR